MRAIVFAIVASLLTLQGVSGAGAHEMAADGVAVARVDCNATPGEHPVDRKIHTLDCCLACNHSAANKSFFPFLVALERVIADLSPQDQQPVVYRQPEHKSPPPCGWATSWASRAPPAIS